MNRHSLVAGTVLSAALGIAALTACDNSAPKATETELEVAEIKGIRFDDPAPTSPATSAAPSEAVASQTPPAAQPSPTPAHATAADVPDNIALIPSATPVPTELAVAEAQTTPEPEPPTNAAPSAPVASGDYEEVSFNVLSGFKYVEPVPNEGEKPEDVEKRRQSDQIPAEVKALDGKKAIVQGWMVPMEISEDGAVKSFVLVKTQPECCFGDMQAMNEWVDVAMEPGKSAEFNVDRPIKVYGKLEVGEKLEDGFVLSVYRMKGERVEL